MVRAFIGVAIPEDIKRYVTGIQKELESLPIKAKLVEPENLHISLSFLGDIEDLDVEKIKFKMDEVVKPYERFEVTLGEIILIPNEKFTRVVSLDVKSDALESIRKAVVKAVTGKSYPAHLTLARVSFIGDRDKFIESIHRINYNEKTFSVDTIDIVQSILQRTGPVYKVLHASHLR